MWNGYDVTLEEMMYSIKCTVTIKDSQQCLFMGLKTNFAKAHIRDKLEVIHNIRVPLSHLNRNTRAFLIVCSDSSPLASLFR